VKRGNGNDSDCHTDNISSNSNGSLSCSKISAYDNGSRTRNGCDHGRLEVVVERLIAETFCGNSGHNP
jgi:hypothetical protein